MAPAAAAPVKLSIKPLLMFALPCIAVAGSLRNLSCHSNVQVLIVFRCHISMPVFSNMKMYFIIADIIILAFFLEALSDYRFNRKPFFLNSNNVQRQVSLNFFLEKSRLQLGRVYDKLSQSQQPPLPSPKGETKAKYTDCRRGYIWLFCVGFPFRGRKGRARCKQGQFLCVASICRTPAWKGWVVSGKGVLRK